MSVALTRFSSVFRILLVAALDLAGPAPAVAQDSDVEMSKISGDPTAPRRHFRLVDPAKLSAQRASEIYAIIRLALQGGYSRSGSAIAGSYQGWRRVNTAPYLSATHGNHYLNNYVNDIGAAYGRFEKAGKLPVGSIIAKDSFSMTRGGEILLGGLFVMEKMPGGFNDVTDDWKYTLIQADGTLFGETNGTGSKRVEYCIACHLARKHQDHLWFLPKPYRVPARN
ncbi:MAG: hypothetical protein A3G80_10570 [Betaproteobacteria bacterium RIFCSPLOWO2_12_FULL_62_13b]|nr:MAG: hypothetical protein A3G80_10570 [Betaproteobacteria bacterium RIFCSPLOWO2_12_FULL_62_13b]